MKNYELSSWFHVYIAGNTKVRTSWITCQVKRSKCFEISIDSTFLVREIRSRLLNILAISIRKINRTNWKKNGIESLLNNKTQKRNKCIIITKKKIENLRSLDISSKNFKYFFMIAKDLIPKFRNRINKKGNGICNSFLRNQITFLIINLGFMQSN